MNKFRTVTLFSMLAVLCMPLAGQAQPKVYGKLMLALENVDLDLVAPTPDGDAWEVKSHASRFGVKGSTDLDVGELQAVYKLEWEIDVSDEKDSDDNHIKARNQYVGLKGAFGQFIMGRHDTPFKKAQGKLDLFNDFNADIKVIMGDGETRANNIWQYSTPKIGDRVQVNLMGIPGEDAAGDNGLADATSFSVTYGDDNLHLALASDSDVAGAGVDATRIVGVYKMGDFGFGALIQDTDYGTADNEEVQIVSVYYKAGIAKLKAQIGSTSNYDGTTNADADLTAFGVDFKLAKKTSTGIQIISQEGGDGLGTTESKDTLAFNIIHSF